jgi:hypothetical protein
VFFFGSGRVSIRQAVPDLRHLNHGRPHGFIDGALRNGQALLGEPPIILRRMHAETTPQRRNAKVASAFPQLLKVALALRRKHTGTVLGWRPWEEVTLSTSNKNFA